MLNIYNIMNDVEATIKIALDDRVIRRDDIVAKVRALVVPAFDEQEQVIAKLNRRINELDIVIDDLADEIVKLEGDVRDRQEQEERQAVVDLFNYCAGGKVVYL